MKTILIAVATFIASIGLGMAQTAKELLTTVGTTVQVSGNHHAYVLWQPGDSGSTLGKRFAVYSKAGTADTAGNYTRHGIQTLQTSPKTIRALLELGEALDPAAAGCYVRIDGIYRDLTLQSNAAPSTPADVSLDAADKLAYIIKSAATDQRLLARLFFLGRAHPGVMQALGHGFSLRITSGVRTFEIREINLSDNDVRVVGRVTLDTASPVVPAAPAAPVQIFHPVKTGSQYTINAKDHLNARLRWGVGTALRGHMPHTFGFDVFRVKRAVAESLGWHTTPPTPAQIVSAIAARNPANPNPDAAAANDTPVLVADLLTPAQAADPANQERIDFSDDGVWHTGADGALIRRPYTDGEQFYFFVAARTITGSPGLLSPGTLVTMCDRIPPKPASVFSVTSNFVRPAAPADWAIQGGSQFLQVKIRQVSEDDHTERAIGYYVYRWESSQQHLDYVGNPTFNRIGAMIPHVPGSTFITFNDNGAGAPTLATHANRSVWYTVRAVGASACAGEVLSGQSAPMSGVLRDFKAPNGPTGSFLVCRSVPSVSWTRREEKLPTENGLPSTYTGMTIEVVRANPTIVEADIEVSVPNAGGASYTLCKRRLSYRTGNKVRIDLPYREPRSDNSPMTITVRAISANGLTSSPAAKTTFASKETPYVIHLFTANATKQCIDVSSATPPVHESSEPDGTVNVISGSITFPLGQGVKEWRVYRRVGPDGSLSLIAKAEGSTIPNPGTWVDDALPAENGVEVCYYGQILDQNANPSPLSIIGCVTLANPDLPTPMLSDAEILSEITDRVTIKLEWFCDPVGVDRFEVLCAADGGGIPSLTGLSEVLDTTAITGLSAERPDLEFYAFQTPRVGGAIGSGPGFGMEITAPTDKPLFFVVRACGPGEYPRSHGSASNIVTARWKPVVTGPQPVIPWPARPMPGDFEHRRPIETYAYGEGPLWPTVMPLDYGFPTGILIGLTRQTILRSSIRSSTLVDTTTTPDSWLFKVRESSGDSSQLTNLMPFMVYRYQVPSTRFPSARANLVQCTPMIDRISGIYINSTKEKGYEVSDPFLLFVSNSQTSIQVPYSGTWTDTVAPTLDYPFNSANRPNYLTNSTGMIFVKDTLPVTQGAKYRHLIVQFEERGEIKRIIPLQPIQH
ncbi:MAG: hypothetical protein RLZZ553_469 [Verrucomicrobiota bacterium]